jgi:hypothetical protein
MRGDAGAAGRDRLSRQLFDCAEQGLAWGKQQFSTTYLSNWNTYLVANDCNNQGSLPCPPFPQSPPGPFQTGYPYAPPFTVPVTIGATQMQYTVGIMNNPENPADPWNDHDGQVIIYSKCIELATRQSRAVQAVLSIQSSQPSDDYSGQAGHGFRNQGNNN